MGTRPGASDMRIKVNVRVPQERIMDHDEEERRKFVPRRFRIHKKDFSEFGLTTLCQGCKALARNQAAQNHSEACRHRVEEHLMLKGDPKVEMSYERFKVHQGRKEDQSSSSGSGGKRGINMIMDVSRHSWEKQSIKQNVEARRG